jgi:hypothetical protein
MDVRHYLNPATGLPHIYDHGFTEAEVEQVLARPGVDRRGSKRPDRPASRRSRQAIGQTLVGRYMRVIYVTEPERDGVFVVTAIPLTRNEIKAYRRQKKRGRR